MTTGGIRAGASRTGFLRVSRSKAIEARRTEAGLIQPDKNVQKYETVDLTYNPTLQSLLKYGLIKSAPNYQPPATMQEINKRNKAIRAYEETYGESPDQAALRLRLENQGVVRQAGPTAGGLYAVEKTTFVPGESVKYPLNTFFDVPGKILHEYRPTFQEAKTTIAREKKNYEGKLSGFSTYTQSQFGLLSEKITGIKEAKETKEFYKEGFGMKQAQQINNAALDVLAEGAFMLGGLPASVETFAASKDKPGLAKAVAITQIEGMLQLPEQFYKDPIKTSMQIALYSKMFSVGGKAFKPVGKIVKKGAIETGAKAGIVRRSTLGFEGEQAIPMMARAEQIANIITNEQTLGATAVMKPIKGGVVKVRDPGALGDVPAGIEGRFMTQSRLTKYGRVDPYGTYFISKSAGMVNTIYKYMLKNRVYIQDMRNVRLPAAMKQEMFDELRRTGRYSKMNKVVKMAEAQSKKYNEPVVIPTPKRMAGVLQPENEAFVIHATPNSLKVTSKRTVGITEKGALVQEIRFGDQLPLTKQNVLQILKYNREFNKVAKKAYLEVETQIAKQKYGELYEGKFTLPGEYLGHGKTHAKQVEKTMLELKKAHPKKYKNVTEAQIKAAAKYHDITKIAEQETFPFKHAESASKILEKRLLKPDTPLSKSDLNIVSKAISEHTKAKPGPKGVLSFKTSKLGRLLSTADRLDLVRYGVKVNTKKLFVKSVSVSQFKQQKAKKLKITKIKETKYKKTAKYKKEIIKKRTTKYKKEDKYKKAAGYKKAKGYRKAGYKKAGYAKAGYKPKTEYGLPTTATYKKAYKKGYKKGYKKVGAKYVKSKPGKYITAAKAQKAGYLTAKPVKKPAYVIPKAAISKKTTTKKKKIEKKISREFIVKNIIPTFESIYGSGKKKTTKKAKPTKRKSKKTTGRKAR